MKVSWNLFLLRKPQTYDFSRTYYSLNSDFSGHNMDRHELNGDPENTNIYCFGCLHTYLT